MELCLETIQVGDYAVALWLHTVVDPPKSEWDAALDRLIIETKDVPTSRMRHFVISDGAAPSAAQRNRMFKELQRGQPLRLAVVTNALSSPLKRGIATALSWTNPEIKFFKPADARGALAHADLSGVVAEVGLAFREMQKKLAPVSALVEVTAALGLPAR